MHAVFIMVIYVFHGAWLHSTNYQRPRQSAILAYLPSRDMPYASPISSGGEQMGVITYHPTPPDCRPRAVHLFHLPAQVWYCGTGVLS